MFENFVNKFKKVKLLDNGEKSKEGNNKKKLENLVVLIIIIIITVLVINNMWNGSKVNVEEEKSTSNRELAAVTTMNSNEVNTTVLNSQKELKKNLEDILSNINGVGKVNVLITFSESSEIVPMYNESLKESKTEESDSEGGKRFVEESDVVKEVIYNEGKGEPVTQKVIVPKIEGAIITAEGAGDITIKSNIIQAVEAITGLPTYKVQVFEMKKM